MNKTKLIVICGFDRIGKDTVLNDLSKKFKDSKDSFIYIQHHDDKPSYRKDPIAFTNWMRHYIENQVNELIDLSQRYKTIYMTRLILSDEVYCSMFNREHIVIQFIDLIKRNFDVQNKLFLFKDYSEYLNRLKQIDDQYVEYSNDEFDKVNKLYISIADEIKTKYDISTDINMVTSKQYIGDLLNVQ